MTERFIPAFKKPLERSDKHAEKSTGEKLEQFQDDRDYVVREITRQRLNKGPWLENLPKAVQRRRQGMRGIADFAKNIFDEMRAQGIDCPVQFVVANNDSAEEALYEIVDDIKPARDFSEMSEKEKSDKGNEVLRVSKNLLKYFAHKATEGGFYPYDLTRREQYVYGTKKGDQEKHLYLVDADPYFESSTAHIGAELEDFRKVIEADKETYSDFKDFDFGALIAECDVLINHIKANAAEE
jgi:hypothetical protein